MNIHSLSPVYPARSPHFGKIIQIQRFDFTFPSDIMELKPKPVATRPKREEISDEQRYQEALSQWETGRDAESERFKREAKQFLTQKLAFMKNEIKTVGEDLQNNSIAIKIYSTPTSNKSKVSHLDGTFLFPEQGQIFKVFAEQLLDQEVQNIKTEHLDGNKLASLNSKIKSLGGVTEITDDTTATETPRKKKGPFNSFSKLFSCFNFIKPKTQRTNSSNSENLLIS